MVHHMHLREAEQYLTGPYLRFDLIKKQICLSLPKTRICYYLITMQKENGSYI